MWSLHYCLLVFIAVMGVMQLAALYNNLRGLLFFPQRIYTLAFSIIAIGVALFGFFTWNDYRAFIVEGIVKEGIVEGSQQTGSFVVSSAAGIVFTLVCSSLLNWRRCNSGRPQQEGLDVLRDSTYFHAIHNHWGEEE
jgi:hypothetical protein